MKLYIAGKISKDSSFGTHHWRDSFCDRVCGTLEELTEAVKDYKQLKIESFDQIMNVGI